MMKKRLLLTVLAFGSLLVAPVCAQGSSPESGKAPREAVLTPPKDARKVDDNTYAYTGKDGKEWTFRKTPFGWVKQAGEATETPIPKPAAAEGMKVKDDGDVVRFERQTPFGVQKWTKRKADLEGWEKQAFEASVSAKKSEKPETKED